VLQEAVGTVKAAQGEHKGAGDMGRSFSSRLRELRRDKALSLRKLGREIGVTGQRSSALGKRRGHSDAGQNVRARRAFLMWSLLGWLGALALAEIG
jgi:hypothetical protein